MDDSDENFWNFALISQKIQQQTLQFTKIAVITLSDMLYEQLDNIIDQKFISLHRVALSTHLFVLQVKNSYKQWKIIKKLTDFISLQSQFKTKYKQKVPRIPIQAQQLITTKNQSQLLQFFQIFLNSLIKTPQLRQHKSFLKFINNYVPLSRKKLKIYNQMYLTKRAGGRHSQSSLTKFINYFVAEKQKYFTITNYGVYYTEKDQNFRIQEMIPFTVGFTLQYGEVSTGEIYGVTLNSVQRVLYIKAYNIFDMVYFVYFIKKAMKQNNCHKQNRYHSFAAQRNNCNSNYYIDSKQYFSDLCDSMLSAKQEIFITGWMISPFFYLKRTKQEKEQTRLDKVLQKIAKSGIKINIILYMQPKVALYLDSQFTQQHLTKLSPNIKVQRHPAYIFIPFLWTHHQKMVIIDQKLAFIGGLDIGYGRFDDNQHRLDDINEQQWPGIDYCNYRKTDIQKPKQFQRCSINRQQQPRMPWHDVAIRLWGQSVIDLSRHFVQFWNYVNFQCNMNQRQLLMYVGLDQQNMYDIKHDGKYDNKNIKNKNQQQTTVGEKMPKIVQENYKNSQNFDYLDVEKDYKNKFTCVSQIDEEELMVNHEQQLQFYAECMQKQSKIDNFLNKLKQTKNSFSRGYRFGINFQQLIVTQNKNTFKQKYKQTGKQKHQILRSASMWSLGLEDGQCQRSILQAYSQLIYNSKQFIYIQNQFFISVENPIIRALVERISRAHESHQKFKVMVILPSLPGFAGQIDNQNSAVLRVQVHHIYKTICKGKKSIYEQLQKNYQIKNIGDYLQFFTLRTHGKIKNKPVTEMIYVHSKLMIVDDQKILIGSANINDRSLLGCRDSQIAIQIQDEQYIQIKLNDNRSKTRKVRKLAHNLRVDLCMQHFSVKRQQIQDYHNEDTWWKMVYHADKNQSIYREVFGIYPDSLIQTFDDIRKFLKNSSIEKYELMKELIKGHAVIFQHCFLDAENLQFKGNQKQFYLPAINFT